MIGKGRKGESDGETRMGNGRKGKRKRDRDRGERRKRKSMKGKRGMEILYCRNDMRKTEIDEKLIIYPLMVLLLFVSFFCFTKLKAMGEGTLEFL